jgi:hypothetical protein
MVYWAGKFGNWFMERRFLDQESRSADINFR